jgi:hypothetical protein
MNIAQRLFIVSSWLFIILAGLLFLVPTDFPSAQGAAWTSLGTGLASHLALLVAIIFDQTTTPPTTAPSEGG